MTSEFKPNWSRAVVETLRRNDAIRARNRVLKEIMPTIGGVFRELPLEPMPDINMESADEDHLQIPGL